MNPLDLPVVQNCVVKKRLMAIRRAVNRTENTGKFDLNHPERLVCGRLADGSWRIPLDFCQYTTDTSINTLATPLFRQVMCLRNDVHQGRVFRKHNARLELNRITAAPPLMPFRHNAVLGRLLFLGDLPFLRGGHR